MSVGRLRSGTSVFSVTTNTDGDGGGKKIGSLRDCKFSREAIDAVGWKGKLCMVNVKGAAAKQRIIYHVESKSWEDMLEGMLAEWRGPAAAMEEETLYVVDESKGWLKKYDHVKDAWVGMVEKEKLKGAQQVAAAGGRVCVLCADGGNITVVDVAAVPPVRLWMVEAPAEVQAVGILELVFSFDQWLFELFLQIK
ncbi:UNVERIFIED_CONTAM: F-box/kelch-repeat protein SKIP25 [Sesamum radiatum]|uniref:F-box/kelch-repeat protein SKIP25 n=1 Tax=Sesamum radiatum TaxID=300843 RepID=A0AAW2QGI4_SESRA